MAKAERWTLFHDASTRPVDACRVCGHRTIPRVQRTLGVVGWVLIGALLGYITLDVLHDGRLDNSIMRLLQAEWARQETPPE
jgi:hypothetical protein